MLSGILKPEWQHDSVEKRMRAIEKMDALDADNQPVFEALAKDDPESCVRLAALDKLSDPEVLIGINQTHADTATREHAESAFSVLIGPKSDLTEDQFRMLIAAHPEVILSVTKHCPHAELRSELVLALSVTEQAELIADIEYNETRQLIAEQLTSEEHLQRARNLLRGKDKSAEKIIKSKLDLIHAQQRQAKENQQTAEHICEKMEFLATHDWRAEFTAKYSVWMQRWEALNFKPDDDVVQRYQQASAKVAQAIAKESSVAAACQGQHKLAQALEDYCGELATLSLRQVLELQSSVAEKLQLCTAEWIAYVASAPADAVITAQFGRAAQALETVAAFCESAAQITQLPALESRQEPTPGEIKPSITDLESTISALQWPRRYPEFEAKTEALSRLDELKTQSGEAQKAAHDKLDKLHKRINRMLGTTNRGDLNRARRELTAVTKAAGHYTGKDKLELDERLEKATEAVNKMADWKEFVTEPKVIELCEAMEALTQSKAHADKLSVEINNLQTRWKALGQSDSADLQWQRFKTASDKAYEPCAAFFTQRHDTRRQNLKTREPFVQQMRELLENTEWDAQPDYKQVETALRNITNEWQEIKDVEPGPGQKQWKKLSKLKSAIYEKLDVVYNANIELKNQLIAQTLVLLEMEVKEDSLAKLQLLQKKWKQVGVTRRKQDQAAWKKFKTATDLVFEKIQGVRKTRRDQEDIQLLGYRQISREIQKLADTATELAAADTDFDRLQAEYKTLPALPTALPEKLIERLNLDFKRACEAYSKARNRIKKAGKAKVMAALANKAALCTELERLGTKAPTTEINRLHQALADIEINNKDLNRRFEQRLAAALDADRSEASRARQLLCIDLEILLGVASPLEDAALRMKIQLERMKKVGIGHAQSQNDQVLNELKLDWLCLPGAEPEIQKKLDQRFAGLIKNRA